MRVIVGDGLLLGFIGAVVATVGRDAWRSFRVGRQLARSARETSDLWLRQLVAPADLPWPRRFASEHGVVFETRSPEEHRVVLETLLDIDVLEEVSVDTHTGSSE